MKLIFIKPIRKLSSMMDRSRREDKITKMWINFKLFGLKKVKKKSKQKKT